ncbi:DUF4145 domain-containing protein (plasmid) [Apilactobacillus apisilvae]|uniref:DUF4145 domain-containing protein n=1 Tax=Apilactobacillus apisilvae TaxID=2923364 RepID=A0ABY4PK85_9LACO|nr:DUF4145 domain-containing protein [Apilactobacillus apisilvae]UQS85843.1 DUF4145 domain-containing protein [Apilactobacillus apisilvae]
MNFDDNGMVCPFCGHTFDLVNNTAGGIYIFFKNGQIYYEPFNINPGSFNYNQVIHSENSILVLMARCPNPKCNKTTIKINPIGTQFKDEKEQVDVYPNGQFKNYPDYVPAYIRKDYKEACLIVNLSPKSSSTLSRRVLEEIISDFYEIKNGKRLVDKIRILEDKNIDPDIIKEFHCLRKIGNIGAHLDMGTNEIPKEVNSTEADALIEAIEDIIDKTYINRHKRQNTLNRLSEIADKYSKKS